MIIPSLFPDQNEDPEAFYFRSLSSGSCGNASLLSCGETMIMIDAGLGIRTLKKSFKELAIDPKQLAAILVTHDHADPWIRVLCRGLLRTGLCFPAGL